MTLTQWLENRWLQRHRTSPEEIENLFKIVERDLKDARAGVSADWRFGIAYNAALKLCTVLLFAEGYRAEKGLQHYRTIQALPKILGAEKSDDASYLDACRSKRNTVEYDLAGAATDKDAEELIDYVESLRVDVVDYLKANYPELLGE